MKRTILQVLCLFFLLAPFAVAEEGEVKKVVYALKSGDVETIKTRLISGIIKNSEYYQAQLKELEVRIVVHGDAYKFFLKDIKDTPYIADAKLYAAKADLDKKLKSLVELYNVKVEVCSIGSEKRGLKPQMYQSYVTLIPNASIGLIDAQNDGFAFLPLN